MARRMLEQALKAYNHLEENLSVANVHHQLGLVDALEGNYKDALQSLERAMEIRSKESSDELVGKTLEAMARVYCLSKDYDRGLLHYRQALSFIKQANRREVILQTMAAIYYQRGDWHGALAVYKNLLLQQRACYKAVASKSNNTKHRRELAWAVSQTLATMCKLYQETSRLADAMRCRQEAEKVCYIEGIPSQQIGL
jgi:tetratricopeptide (TPR) repeat protein